MGRVWSQRGPWWLYVLVVGGLNVVRQIVFPPSRVGGGLTILLFFVVLAVSFGVIEVLRLAGGKPNRADRPR